MHYVLKSYKQKPTKKFAKTSSILKNLKKISKAQKPRSNAWRMKESVSLPVKKHLI